MSAKRIQLADGTWQALDLFSRDLTKTFQERADESFADLLAKPGRPQRGARATGRGLFSALQQCEGRRITFVAFPGATPVHPATGMDNDVTLLPT